VPRRYSLYADPARVGLLATARVDVVSLANNHALDCGPRGLEEAVRVLGAAGIAAAGVEVEGRPQEPVVLLRRGRRVGVLAYSAADDPAWSARGTRYARLLPGSLAEIRAARARVDVLVVSVHWGREEQAAPLPAQREWARRLVEAGADVVVGHHAHVLQPVERLGGAVVLYGLGNLVFDRSGPAGAVARIDLGDGPPRLTLLPIRIEGGRVIAGE
jgi:poly-gamma-glutamate synthesis protein (capsule biosynthesis protein)